MKWKAKKPIKEGDSRIVKRFALLPITEWIKEGDTNRLTAGKTIWLETVYIRQTRVAGRGGNEYGGGEDFWMNLEFVSKDRYK